MYIYMYVVISIIISIPSRQYLVNSEDKLPSFNPEKITIPNDIHNAFV